MLDSKTYFLKCSKSQPLIMSKGSMMFPFDLDIFSPLSSLTRLCMNTFLKGTLSFKSRLIITILITQKNRMSYPVSKRSLG